ncbi:DHA2 family efflux MFS transporter permease subunit [Amycolatopsis sp. CA-230715]|uniref:DHA2 family efflux MFS transporter permease subunit n=1 Tax=Amycolatopsis sp. CA-230715 TaxID=2745196 RepID=UPI001C00E23E|nr:DHA2 family efflux MFS transporter permease subunit [Amycolatopsis sp. CA-230715]QWF82779.1 putative transport protein HsrA [Amycolatopsis sp. CA-230715]
MSANTSERVDLPLLRLGAVLVLGAFMALLDATIVNVGLDSLATEFRVPLGTAQWAITGYLLAVSVAIPVSGWAVDRFGGRVVWLVAAGLFTIGSLAAGCSWSTGSLVGFRVLQGFGGGMLEPVTQVVVAAAAGPRRVGRMMGLISVPLMLAPAAGPVLGGLLLDQLGWRWLFLVNVPVGVVAMLLALRYVPRDSPRGATARLDLAGLVLLASGFAALVIALAQREPVALVVGIALLAAYVAHALLARTAPLLDPRMFASRGFAATAVAMLLVGVVVFGTMFLLPLYAQTVRGHDAMVAGLLLAPQGIGGMLGMPLAGRLADRIPPRRLVPLALALLALTTVPYMVLDEGTSEVWLACVLFVRGVALTAVVAPLLASIYRTVTPDQAPRATAAIYILNQIGGSLGTALLATVVVASGFGDAFTWLLGFTAAAFVASLLLPGKMAGEVRA